MCNRLTGGIVTFLNAEINEEPNKRGGGGGEGGEEKKKRSDRQKGQVGPRRGVIDKGLGDASESCESWSRGEGGGREEG